MRKILPVILTVCMLISICTVTASAAVAGIEIPENAELVYTNNCTTLDGWTGNGKVTANAYDYEGSAITLNAKNQSASFNIPEEYCFAKNSIVTFKFYSVSLNHAFSVGLAKHRVGGNVRAVYNSKNYLTYEQNVGYYFYNGAQQSKGWHEFAALVDSSGSIQLYIDGQLLTKNGAAWSITGETISQINMSIPGWYGGYEGAVADIKIYKVVVPEGINEFIVNGKKATIDDETGTITAAACELDEEITATYTLREGVGALDIQQNERVCDGQKITYTNGDVTLEYTLKINKTPFAKEGLLDEEFFGKWENGEWVTEGKLNYEYNGGVLEEVEACVKTGDYNGAKVKLLEYFRNRTGISSLPMTEIDISLVEESPKQAILTSENIFSDVSIQDRIEFESDVAEVSAEVTEAVVTAFGGSKEICFYLWCADKSENVVSISSREGENPPVIILENAEGNRVEVYPSKDSYITGGTNENYGGAEELKICGHGYPFDTKESRAYMVFDLKGVEKDFEPVKAVLKVTGRNNSEKGEKTEVMVFTEGDCSWNESTVTWKNIIKGVYSWKGGTFDWKAPANSRGEWINGVSRMYYMPRLAVEWRKNPAETKYSETYVRLLWEFMGQNAYYFPSPSTEISRRSIDVANRSITLMRSYDFFRKSEQMTAEVNTELLKLLWQQADYVRKDVKMMGNNWDVLNAQSLYYASSFFPEFKNVDEWSEYAQKIIKQRMMSLTCADGSCIEGCIWYSTVVASGGQTVVGLAQLNGGKVDPEIRETVTALQNFVMNGIYPNGQEINWGDGTTRNLLSYIESAANITATHYRDYFKYVATGGKEGTEPPFTSTFFAGVSSAAMRSGWTSDAVYMFMTNYSKGHSHPDLLSPLVYAYDKPLIADAGKTGYDVTSINMNWLRGSTEAHNTIEINNTNQAREKGKVNNWITNSGADFYDGAHSGYDGFDVHRSVLFVKPDYFIVSDYINPTDAETVNRYDQHWHYHPGANLSLDGVSKKTQTAYDAGANIQVVPADGDEITATLRDGYNATYGLASVKFTEYTKEVAGEVTFDTILYPTKEGDTREVTVERLAVSPDIGKKATALSINTGGGIDTYYMSHLAKDFETVTFGNYTFDGKVAFISENNLQIIEGTTLAEGETDLVKSNSSIRSISLRFEGNTLEIDGERLEKTTDKEKAIAIYAPDVTSVTYKGATVDFVKDGDYIYAVGNVVTDDNTLFREEFTSDLSSWSNRKNVLINNSRLGVYDGGIASRNISGMGYILDAETEIAKDSAEIHFNVKDLNENEYILKLDAEAGKAVFVKNVDGTGTVLAEKAFSFEKHRKYAVRIESGSRKISVQLDGVQIIDISDSTYTYGTVALGTSAEGYAYFDNVIMTAMDFPDEPIFEDFEDKEGSVGGSFPVKGNKAWEQTGTSTTSAIVKETTDRGGNTTKALFFDGVNANINLKNQSLPEEGDYTLSMWIYDEFVSGSITNFTVNFDNSFVGFDPNLVKSNVWRCRPSTATSSAGNANVLTTEGKTIPRSKGWHHLEMKVQDGLGILYIDGVETTFKEKVSSVNLVQRSGWFSGSVKNIIYVDDIEVILPDKAVRGDADTDGKVTVYDAVHILKNVSDITDDIDIKAADVDGDGMITVNDATNILRYIARLILSL